MQFLPMVMGFLGLALPIRAQQVINWDFFEPGSNCNRPYGGHTSNQIYMTTGQPYCMASALGVGEYDVLLEKIQIGLDSIGPNIYACPTKECNFKDCELMRYSKWAGNSDPCEHMYNSPYWYITAIYVPKKRGVNGMEGYNETEGPDAMFDGPGPVITFKEIDTDTTFDGLGPVVTFNETDTDDVHNTGSEYDGRIDTEGRDTKFNNLEPRRVFNDTTMTTVGKYGDALERYNQTEGPDLTLEGLGPRTTLDETATRAVEFRA